jgi:hypothetical protein
MNGSVDGKAGRDLAFLQGVSQSRPLSELSLEERGTSEQLVGYVKRLIEKLVHVTRNCPSPVRKNPTSIL